MGAVSTQSDPIDRQSKELIKVSNANEVNRIIGPIIYSFTSYAYRLVSSFRELVSDRMIETHLEKVFAFRLINSQSFLLILSL